MTCQTLRSDAENAVIICATNTYGLAVGRGASAAAFAAAWLCNNGIEARGAETISGGAAVPGKLVTRGHLALQLRPIMMQCLLNEYIKSNKTRQSRTRIVGEKCAKLPIKCGTLQNVA